MIYALVSILSDFRNTIFNLYFASLCNIKRRAAYVQKIEVMNISYSCFSKCTANIKIFYWCSLSLYYWAKYRRIIRPSIQNHFYFYCKDDNYILIQLVVLDVLDVFTSFKDLNAKLTRTNYSCRHKFWILVKSNVDLNLSMEVVTRKTISLHSYRSIIWI